MFFNFQLAKLGTFPISCQIVTHSHFVTLSLNIYSNFTFLDFSFEIEVTLSVKTKKDQRTSWPLKAKLQIAEQEKKIQMKYLNSEWQELPNNITIDNITFTNEFKSDKIKIEFKSIAGENFNFGKKDDAEPVDPINIKFTTFWELDHANKPSNTGVGAVLENVDEPTRNEAVINVESGCKDVENCICDVKLTSLEMTSPSDQNYIVGEVSKLNFDLVLENSGNESALNTKVRLISPIINPTNNANNKPKGDSLYDVEEWEDPTTTETTTYKYMWQWKIAAISNKRPKTVSFKFQLDKVNFTGQDSPLEKFNVEVITWCDRASQELKGGASQALNFKYKSEVKWDTDEAKNPVSFNDDSGEVPFTQTFQITNKGPSPKREKTQLKIYIPETKLVKSKYVQIIDGKNLHNCTKDITGTISLSMTCNGAKEVISCQGNTKCAPYTCNIDQNWKKGKSYKINVPMSFSATNAEHKAYEVCVYAKVEGIFYIFLYLPSYSCKLEHIFVSNTYTPILQCSVEL